MYRGFDYFYDFVFFCAQCKTYTGDIVLSHEALVEIIVPFNVEGNIESWYRSKNFNNLDVTGKISYFNTSGYFYAPYIPLAVSSIGSGK